ncbi:MAG: branched-chain amino acid ABC transporter permease, partial [Anaerolineae bacterium]|nr:branched-chain amino acid ABC transporter permease [Anaerolineae bacterium]
MNIDLGATLVALLTFFGIAALMALSLNLEYGTAGVPNFGQAVFVSIGAYTTAITYTRLLPLLAGKEVIWPCGPTLGPALQLRSEIMTSYPGAGLINLAITLVIAASVSGLVGYFVSRIALRLQQEWFLALVLLVGGETVRIFVRSYEPVICANNGISGVAQPFAWLGNPQQSSILFMVLVLVVTVLTWSYCERLVRSPFGRLLRALRENATVTRSLGKNVALARARVMLVGSAVAAVAGVFFVLNTGYISSN